MERVSAQSCSIPYNQTGCHVKHFFLLEYKGELGIYSGASSPNEHVYSSKNDRKVKTRKNSKISYVRQSALNCSYTALTAACRGPNTWCKRSS